MQLILPLIVLFIAAGAWRAWRHNPMYSLRVNLQFAVALLAMLAAIVGLTLWISRGSALSATVKVTLIILSILLMLAGFIAMAFRITNGREAAVPQGVSLCDPHRRRLLPWLYRAGIVLAFVLTSALLAPPSWIALPVTLGVMILLLATVVLYPLYLKARRFDRGVTALMANAWVRWQYTPERWQSWAAIQRSWERARTPVFRWSRDWPKLLLPILLILVFTGLMGDGAPGAKAIVFVSCATLILVSSALLTWAARTEPERRYRRMLTARREAYMGPDGLYCSGEYTPWILSGNYLVEVTAIYDPPARLVLTFEKFTGNASIRVARLIPIPEGREGDLDVLQNHFRVRCPKATIHLQTPAAPTI